MNIKYNPEKHHRRSIRLRYYDYSQSGAYFVTICTYNRECLFGKINDEKMKLSAIGKIVYDEWVKLPKCFINIELDEFVIMPNHMHGIVIIVGATLAVAPKLNELKGAAARAAPTNIGNIIGAYKSLAMKVCLNIYKRNKQIMGKLWQRNYYEHIIRNEEELNRIREYIVNNPLKWSEDENNPMNIKK